jgi:hypothetical protein
MRAEGAVDGELDGRSWLCMPLWDFSEELCAVELAGTSTSVSMSICGARLGKRTLSLVFSKKQSGKPI